MSMDRPQVRAISVAALEALKQIEERYGVKATYKGGNYDDNSCVLKFEFANVNEDGTAFNREMTDLKRVLPNLEWTEDDINAVYQDPLVMQNEPFMIVGYNTRARKNSIILERLLDKKRYSINHNAVNRLVQGRKVGV